MSELKTLTREVIETNEARCLSCGDVIRSQYTHDFNTCSCGNLSVDGGLSYRKRNFRDGMNSWEELSEFHEETYAPDWLQDGYKIDFSKRQSEDD